MRYYKNDNALYNALGDELAFLHDKLMPMVEDYQRVEAAMDVNLPLSKIIRQYLSKREAALGRFNKPDCPSHFSYKGRIQAITMMRDKLVLGGCEKLVEYLKTYCLSDARYFSKLELR